MGRRYICEYCDRSFIDEISARKKHLNSIQHIRNKKVYYDSIRDLKTLVEEESKKETCGRFQRTGQCSFGNACIYTHYSQYELEIFRRQVAEEEKVKSDVERIKEELSSVNDWLTHLKMKSKENHEISVDVNSYYSDEAANPFLPPSLQKPPFELFASVGLTDWG